MPQLRGGVPGGEGEIHGRGSWLSRAWWLHPLLLGAFPVLFLFAANLNEQVTLEPIVEPLALAIAASALLLVTLVGVMRLLGRDPARAGLLASMIVVLFFSYGHVWQAVDETLRLHRYLLGVWAVLGLVGAILVFRARIEHVRMMVAGLNLAAAFLVVVNAVPIVGFAIDQGRSVAADPAPGATPVAGASDADPDIWYLVFDRYGGGPGLADAYSFDNSPFLASLEERGFAVAEAATANYLKTALSLAATLEMDYLDTDAYAEAATAPDDWTPLYRTLQGTNAVERFVHARGYEYLHLGVRRGATYTNATADRTFLYTDYTEFSAVLMGTTLLAAAENLGGDAPGGLAGLYGNQSLYQFDVLEQLAKADAERPRFIFAHFLLPHPPYVFNADGSWVSPEQTADRTPDQQYVEQVRYTNARILELVDAIVGAGRDGTGPVVLIQADEGPFPDRYARDEEGFAWADATEAELLEKFSILAAYYVSGVTEEELGVYPTITPVNSFRLIFDNVFDAGLELLPDRNLVFVDQRHIYETIDVTDRVAEAVR